VEVYKLKTRVKKGENNDFFENTRGCEVELFLMVIT
jgi:hypothetical protein